jgi:nucleoside-diphosphate-sugar epimerase
MTNRIAMTGASGFVGSALAASFLLTDDSLEIFSVAPDDHDGEAARRAVRRSLTGFGGPPGHAERVQPLAVDLSRDESAARSLGALELGEFWHVAAHMSYELGQLRQAFAVNAVASTRLFHALGSSGRFYFISTTGVAGPGDQGDTHRVVREELLTEFEALNPYTLSKIMAEYMLWHASAQTGTPLTVLRPGSVVGHSRNGWSGGSRYGYYSYLHAFKRFVGREPVFFVDIDPERRFPVVHVDHFVDIARRLRARSGAPGREILHTCNRNPMTAREHFAIYEQVSGNRMRIDFGPGEKGFNQVFNQMNADNNRFLGTRHSFDDAKLVEAIGADGVPPLTRDGIATVMAASLSDARA